MAREIKFRAWCEVDGNPPSMIYFEPAQCDNGVFCMPTPNNISHIDEYLSPLMQFTGLKDKNDKEIYEGDIVLQNTQRCEVKYGATCFYFHGLQEYFNGRVKHSFDAITNYYLTQLWDSEVIGNIYENPELIK